MKRRALPVRTAVRAGEACDVLAADQEKALANGEWKMVNALAELADWQGCQVFPKIYVAPAPAKNY